MRFPPPPEGVEPSFNHAVLANSAVERTFPLYSPLIKEMTVLDRKRVRRAKLFYLRHKPISMSRV